MTNNDSAPVESPQTNQINQTNQGEQIQERGAYRVACVRRQPVSVPRLHLDVKR